MSHLRSLLFLFTASTALLTTAQGTTAMAQTQFDFWLGEWDLTWADGGKGSNSISKEMNGHVVHERFADPATNYHGESWSMWDAATNKWKQTWVDDQGNYMAFEGGMVEDAWNWACTCPTRKPGSSSYGAWSSRTSHPMRSTGHGSAVPTTARPGKCSGRYGM